MGIYLLKLANKAPTIFKSSEPEVKRQLIKLILQNPIVNGTTLNATIRKPFSLWAKGPSRTNWLPQVDEFCNWLNSEETQKLDFYIVKG